MVTFAEMQRVREVGFLCREIKCRRDYLLVIQHNGR